MVSRVTDHVFVLEREERENTIEKKKRYYYVPTIPRKQKNSSRDKNNATNKARYECSSPLCCNQDSMTLRLWHQTHGGHERRCRARRAAGETVSQSRCTFAQTQSRPRPGHQARLVVATNTPAAVSRQGYKRAACGKRPTTKDQASPL